ncbi:MAG: hydroxymethylbilane synthase [Dichotomicrobium sp.]
MTEANPIRIGTRGSNLALAQVYEMRDRLCEAHGMAQDDFEVVVIKTSGDMIQDKALREFGGKGLFTKEIEEALSAGDIDMAVHSMKDVPTFEPDGLEMVCMMPRADVRDAFISLKAERLSELPQGAVVGTSSLRRQAQVKQLRPDIEVITYRGNVETRLRKLEEGVADATLLAVAGLQRLGHADKITAPVSPDEMLPAIAQGAIGIQIREADDRRRRLLEAIDDAPTQARVSAERAFLAELDGSCRTPIAGLAELDGDQMRFRGEILLPDGSQAHRTERSGPARDAAAMGKDAAQELLRRAGPEFMALIV